MIFMDFCSYLGGHGTDTLFFYYVTIARRSEKGNAAHENFEEKGEGR